MRSKSMPKNVWVLILFMLAGIIVGGFIGELCHMLGSVVSPLGFLKWLTFGKAFGLSSPLVIDVEVIKLSFMLTIKFSICGILGMFAGIFAYRKL